MSCYLPFREDNSWHVMEIYDNSMWGQQSCNINSCEHNSWHVMSYYNIILYEDNSWHVMSLLCENIQNQHTDELHLSSRTLLGAPDLRRVLILNMKEGHMSTVHDSSAQLELKVKIRTKNHRCLTWQRWTMMKLFQLIRAMNISQAIHKAKL